MRSSRDFALPANGALSGFSVTVRCTQAAGALPRFQVIATACNQPVGGVCATANATNHPDYVQRVVQAKTRTAVVGYGPAPKPHGR